MLDLKLKELKDNILRMFKGSIPLWFSPLICTYLAFAFGVLSILFAFNKLLTLSFYCWIMNRFLDGLDGI